MRDSSIAIIDGYVLALFDKPKRKKSIPGRGNRDIEFYFIGG